MRTIIVWLVGLLLSVCGARYAEPDLEKQVDLPEPSCEELRAMWRYTKRQSRAARTTNVYPISLEYPNPFSYNVWQNYKEIPPLTYTRRVTGRPRSRAASGAPVYGRMVHKAPAGSRLRNGMRHRSRAFEDMNRPYGTVNQFQPSTRRRLPGFHGGGGASPSYPQLPQVGSFLYLTELIRAERARELQEQHMAEKIASKAAFEEAEEEMQPPSVQQRRKQYLSPLPLMQIPSKMYDELGQNRYMSGAPIIGQAWSRSEPQSREYMLR